MVQYVAKRFREAEFDEFEYPRNFQQTFNFQRNNLIDEDDVVDMINYEREQELLDFVLYNKINNNYNIELGNDYESQSLITQFFHKTFYNIEDAVFNTYYDIQFMKYNLKNLENLFLIKSKQILTATSLKLMYLEYRINKAFKNYFN